MASVAKLHLHRFGPGSASQQLVSEAYGKDRGPILLYGRCNMAYSYLERSGIARTVRDEQSIVILTSKLGKITVPRYNENLNTSTYKASQLIEF